MGETVTVKRKILVADDVRLNREILRSYLQDKYALIEAKNGEEALDLLKRFGSSISLIILNIVMPKMSGYELMKQIQKTPEWTKIPIIVNTAEDTIEEELRCLELGASDFMRKEYNAEILKKRIRNLIHLRESSALLKRIERDPLTDLYNKEFFYAEVDQFMARDPEQKFDIVCFDIDSFKLVNEYYTEKIGDVCLKLMANVLTIYGNTKYVTGRLGGDVFAVLKPHISEEEHQENAKRFQKHFDNQSPVSNLKIKFGVCPNIDSKVSAAVACERARLAIDSIKHQYDEYLVIYNDQMKNERKREQELLDMAAEGFEQYQFQVYYQPKHNLENGALCGAEALVRWIHPEKGFLSPGEFIPLFEKNGLITELDCYVCRQVCRDIRNWLVEGKQVVPISMNLSRIDFKRDELAEVLIALVDRYEVPHDLLHFEITESAYFGQPGKIEKIIRALHEAGFMIELDDFGSGYSSLNILDKLTYDIIKLDMEMVRQVTLPNKTAVPRLVVNLAKELEVKIVAEGVETGEQQVKLQEIGCDYAQGYLYSKPIPRDDFEAYITKQQAV